MRVPPARELARMPPGDRLPRLRSILKHQVDARPPASTRGIDRRHRALARLGTLAVRFGEDAHHARP